MGKTVALRLAAFPATLLAASVLLFIAINVLPGSAARSALGIDATPQAIARFEAQFGLDRPWPLQYWDWLRRLSHGDFGTSFQNGVAVGPELAARIPVTLELAVLAFVIVNLVAIPLGMLAAAQRGRPADSAIGAFAVIAGAMPSFWLATLLVMVFTLHLHWLPASGFTPLSADPLLNLRQMAMPALSLALVSSAVIIRIMRTSTIEVLGANYILTAAAKGASRSRVLARHAFPNAAIPTMNVAAVEFGFLFGGVVIIEDIFRLPGVGALVLTGIVQRDYPVLMAGALTVTAFVLLTNLIVDLAAALIDPRPKQTEGR